MTGITDRPLARRLERAEGAANAAFIDARDGVRPELGATWTDIGGTWAMFDGADSPLTQTFGLGLFTDVSDGALDELEHFFTTRGSATHHEVSPIADPRHLEMLSARGYRPIEQSTVLVRSLATERSRVDATMHAVAVRIAPASDADAWADLAARGWGESAELAEFMRDFGGITARARGVTIFVAAHDGRDVATGAMAIHEGVALLAGASTLPDARRRGAQAALLQARLGEAARLGCDLAMMAAAPGSTSQCNAERQGFRVAYTRTKWRKAPG